MKCHTEFTSGKSQKNFLVAAQEIKKGDKMNNDTQFLASGHSLKKISSKISSLQATKESVGVLGIAFGKKSLEEILIKILLTQEIKKGDRMKKDK